MYRNLIVAMFLMIVTSGGLCGCNAMGRSFKPVEFDQNEEAVIYIYRPAGSAGWLDSLGLKVNGKKIGQIANNGYGYVIVKPGIYKVRVAKWNQWSIVQYVVVTIAAGEIAYVRPYISGGGFGNMTQIRLDDELVGARKIQNMKLQFGKRLDVESFDSSRMFAMKVNTLTEGATRPTAEIVDELAGAIVSVRTLRGHGTGFIVSENGHCLTSRHVVGQTATVQLIWKDGTSVWASVRNTDVGTDSAMLGAMGSRSQVGSVVAPIAAGSYPVVGDKVMVIGSPTWPDAQAETDMFVKHMGSPLATSPSQTVSKGIVTSVQTLDNLTLIHTNIVIKQGQSGCPLINERGEVIGIISMKLAGKETGGLGIAVPIVDIFKGLRVVASDHFETFDKDNP